ncbi:integral membrane protein [Nannizzia gypsea CBS 118893]|uniref:Integral membrane protein n=1 Tax=Arthroderma gypseum (strain ATCC MYA-4604 / CBS 118893) TaxID=535722 RepID=E5QZA1_ARTGP|nr:integral membrane protein [Nannizzia gypsea CBS 118893]EFQ97333.1 integral membrane protein [Nannizzia gypsea CBS 118893]
MDMTVSNEAASSVASAAAATATAAVGDTAHLMSYFKYQKHSGTILAHIVLMAIAWVVILPVGIVFSVAKSRFALPTQFGFLIVNAVAVLCGLIYSNQTPDLYENNVHNKIGWVATWVMVAEAVMGLLLAYSSSRDHTQDKAYERIAFLSVNTQLGGAGPYSQDTNRQHRWSADSGQGSEEHTYSPRSRCSSFEHDRQEAEEIGMPNLETNNKPSSRRLSSFGSLDRYLKVRIPQLTSRRVLSALSTIHTIVERTILILGFVALTSGAVVYTGIFRGRQIFNGLAHFIKGGIFMWYGFLTLGRWLGCFADFGWAWNIKPSRAIVGAWKAKIPTAEFTESFVIFLYGASNMFLEHLGGWGGPWTAHDLEHVSITIMFFGGGLCGMLAESRRVRDWINMTALGPPPIYLDKEYASGTDEWRPPRSQGVSLNPMPATIILLLGLMMSSHHQHSMVSTMVHKQWGMLLVGFSLARAVTYILLYINPPSSILPSRPPSELVTSFCLISGGLVFMLSTADVVAAMEYYDVNAMIVFTIGMGVTALAMAWEIVLISLKAWATKTSVSTPPIRDGFKFPE